MILGVILCYVISVQIEARTIIPAYVVGQQSEMKIKRIREENDVYRAETVQLNGRSTGAPSWPKTNSENEKMFLLPSILKQEDQINITGLISPNAQWVSVSLILEQHGPNGAEPDYNNIASQLNLYFPSHNSEEEKTVLKTIVNGAIEEIDTSLPPTGLIPDISSNTTSEVSIILKIVVSRSGYEVEFFVGDSYVDKISLKHQFKDIRYIAMDGNVEKIKRLDFAFS